MPSVPEDKKPFLSMFFGNFMSTGVSGVLHSTLWSKLVDVKYKSPWREGGGGRGGGRKGGREGEGGRKKGRSVEFKWTSPCKLHCLPHFPCYVR